MCGDGQVIRCPGCPGTDWSAFGWEYYAPASPGVLQPTPGGLKRYFKERSAVMFRPGVCNCLWICGAGDWGSDPSGTLQPSDHEYPISSIASLQYRRVANVGRWQIQVSRFYGGYGWTPEDAERYGYGWGWNDELVLNGQCGENASNADPYYGGWWGGYGGYGYNGWGWGWGGGYAYGVALGGAGTLYSVTYSIADGEMNCHGEWVRFWLDTPSGFFDRDAWPEFVDVRRIQN